MIFDDGTEMWTDASGTSYATNASGAVVSAVDAGGNYSYLGDAREASKLDSYVARPAGDTRPWYERVAEFGFTRAIDAHYGTPATPAGSQPASYAGQNGATYANGFGSLSSGGMLPLLLIGGAVVLAVVLMD